MCIIYCSTLPVYILVALEEDDKYCREKEENNEEVSWMLMKNVFSSELIHLLNIFNIINIMNIY